MKRMSKLWIIVILGIVMLVSAPAVFAQEGEGDDDTAGDVSGGEVTDDDVNDIAGELYCPVCENIPLDVCGTQACADWRDEIRVMLQEGQSDEDIKAYFADTYGRRVLATPDAKGVDLIVWVLPPLGVVVGLVVLVGALRRMAPKGEGTQAPSTFKYSDLDQEYVARLEAELKEFAE